MAKVLYKNPNKKKYIYYKGLSQKSLMIFCIFFVPLIYSFNMLDYGILSYNGTKFLTLILFLLEFWLIAVALSARIAYIFYKKQYKKEKNEISRK